MEGIMDCFPAGMEIGEYTIHETLGTGAFSCVYRITKESSSIPYGMKVISKKTLSHEGDAERLQRELDTMAFLRHPNIVALHDFFSDDNYFYLILDYCKGGDLSDYIANLSAPMREQQAASIFIQIVSAINFIHQHGVAHRDLKPQNILISTFPTIKISDFGLCGFIEESKMKTFCGTPCYTAPECINRVQYSGVTSDIWSLGVILYEIVTGKHPWDVKNITKMIKQISSAQFTVPSSVTPACDELIKSILKVRPNDRPSCEKILNHPWMKLASSRNKMQLNATLPPLLRNSLGSFAKTIDRRALHGDLGIASPFNGQNSTPIPNQFNSTGPIPIQPPGAINVPSRGFVRSRSGTFSKTIPKRPNAMRQMIVANQPKRDSYGSITALSHNSDGGNDRKMPPPIPLPPVQLQNQ